MSQQTEPSRLAWLASRLSVMSAAEMGYRVRQAYGAVFARPLSVDAATVSRQTPAPPWINVEPQGIEAAPYLHEANAILDGLVDLFSTQQVNLGALPQWDRHPLESNPTPAGDGDIKYVWELNRHLHWVRLAQAYVLSGDGRYCRGLAQQLDSWLDQCPPAIGPNWSSASELAIRLINWSVVWQLLGGRDSVIFEDQGGEQLRARWLSSIQAHCLHISLNFSRHSSANNHLIGELTGLYVASRTWPMPPQSETWARQAKAELEYEAVIQHFADGGSREQAFAYQVFACEYLLIAGICGQRNGDRFSDKYWAVLRRACRFLKAVMNVSGALPMVGDADDGAVLRLEPREGASRPALLVSCSDAVFGKDNERRRDTAQWLGAECLLREQSSAPASEKSPDWQFHDSGYHVFGSHFNTPHEVKGMVDCGVLGYLGIAAHGHADALAIWLSIAGEECLVDSGTYAYGGDYAWRAYFRGTSAHNTICIDGIDQSVSGGRFLWKRKAQATVTRMPISAELFKLTATHDGYARLRDPVYHTREVTYDAARQHLCVKDEISGRAPHDIEQFWHFAPHVNVQINDTGLVIARGKQFELTMRGPQSGTAVSLVRGQENPPLGWYSPAYGIKVPTTVARIHTKSCPTTIETHFSIRING